MTTNQSDHTIRASANSYRSATAIAGTAASLRAQEMSQDDELLRARMRVVNAKEESINEHEKRVRAEAEGLRRVVGQVYDALHHLDSAQGEARHSLQEQREDLTDTFLRSQEEEPSEPRTALPVVL